MIRSYIAWSNSNVMLNVRKWGTN